RQVGAVVDEVLVLRSRVGHRAQQPRREVHHAPLLIWCSTDSSVILRSAASRNAVARTSVRRSSSNGRNSPRRLGRFGGSTRSRVPPGSSRTAADPTWIL